MPDRVATAREMRRVLRLGGRVGVAVWLSSPRLEPFIVYGDALQARGVPEPFAHAYDSSANSMSASEVENALVAAGFAEVDVRTEQLELACGRAPTRRRAPSPPRRTVRWSPGSPATGSGRSWPTSATR